MRSTQLARRDPGMLPTSPSSERPHPQAERARLEDGHSFATELLSAPRLCYWRAMVMRKRSSGSMKWSWSSVPTSSCTQWMRPVNRLPCAV